MGAASRRGHCLSADILLLWLGTSLQPLSAVLLSLGCRRCVGDCHFEQLWLSVTVRVLREEASLVG